MTLFLPPRALLPLLLCVLVLRCVSGAAVGVVVRRSALRLELREESVGEAFIMRPFLDDASLDPSA